MIVSNKIHEEKDGSVGYIENVYDSSNILTSTYFPKTNIMYIAFNRGGVYSYGNISKELHEQFVNAESQGKFFVKEIKNNDAYPFLKEFKLFESEINDAKKLIEEWRENQQLKS
jgi:hypothetical protein